MRYNKPMDYEDWAEKYEVQIYEAYMEEKPEMEEDEYFHSVYEEYIESFEP